MFKVLALFLIVALADNKCECVKITTVNKCAEPLWIGVDGNKTPKEGGWKLDAGARVDVDVDAHFNGRFWARTKCTTNGGKFHCETGNCGPWVGCNNGGVRRGGEPPVSLAEFNLNTNVGGLDFYDVSLVDGYNVKMSIVPKTPDGSNKCQSLPCNSDLNSSCPEQLKKKNANGKVIACYSGCSKFNTDQYCCRGAHNLPSTCKPNTWPVNFTTTFKKACPKAYSYAYDDPTSLFSCKKTGYDIIFC